MHRNARDTFTEFDVARIGGKPQAL
jgi:hypothetical protein